MNHRFRRFWPLLLAVTLTPLSLRAADQRAISQAIAQLGDVDPRIREKASRFLWQLGREAEPAITEALKSDDPEVVSRCRAILTDFKYGIYPDTPSDIVAQVRAYRTGNALAKRAAVAGLMRIGPRAYPAVVQLAQAETDPGLRAQIIAELSRVGDRGASGFIAVGDFASAEKCLETALSDGNSRARSYVTFLLLRGTADQKRSSLRSDLQAYLLRGKGDLAGARREAEKSHDEKLLEGILLEQVDWKTLAARHSGDGEGEANAEQLAFRAAYQRLAGDAVASGQTLDLIANLPQRFHPNAWSSAKAFLLNDRPRQAIDLLIKEGETTSALELLLAQQRYSEALDLADKVKQSKAVNLARIAKTLHYLGEKEKSDVALREAVALAPTGGMPAWVAIVDAEARTGRRQNALAHAAHALTEMNDPPAEMFEKLFARSSSDGEALWPVLRARDATDQPREVMARLDELLSGKWPGEEVSKLSREVREGKIDLTNRPRAVRALINVVQKANLKEELALCSRKLAEISADPRDLTSLSAAAIAAKDWNTAAELAVAAMQKDPSRAAPRYFRGYCLGQLGRKKDGAELMEIARILPLADDAHRYEFAEQLDKAGLTDVSGEQQQLLLRTGDFAGWEYGNVTRMMAHRASEKGDDLTAAALWERSTLPCLRDNTGFVDTVAYLGVPHLIHRTRARGLLKAGKADEALKELRLSEEYLPGDITLAIDMAAPLRQAGREKDLIDLVERILQHEESVLVSYPRSAMIHNSAAWMLARCRLKLEVALAHAQKAAELEPQSAAILDTLAETHFQLGQKEKAIAAMQSCIELEPKIERHKAQLRRFERGSPDSLPPS